MKQMGKAFLTKLICLALISLLLLTVVSCGSRSAGSELPNDENRSDYEDGFKIESSEKTDQTVSSNRKMIKRYRIAAETKQFDAAVDGLESLVIEYGGYVENSNLSRHSYENATAERSASYTLRIPAERAEAFVGAVGNSMNVTRMQSSTDDVSDTYYSTEAMLEELQAERDSLLAMMEASDSQTDYNFWLTLQQRLSEVKQKIAVYQRQLMNYDDQVSYSTITLTVEEVTNDSSPTGGFWEQLGVSFVSGWTMFGEGVQDFLIWLVGALPILLCLGTIVALILLITRRRKRKNDKRDD